MIAVRWLFLYPPPLPKFAPKSRNSLSLIPRNETLLTPSLFFKPQIGFKSSRRCCCFRRENTAKSLVGFSVVKSDLPWDSGTLWSTLALYLFSFHVPLSFGGLSVVSYALRQSNLDPQTEALSLLVIQLLELKGVFWFLTCFGKPQYNPFRFFQAKKKSKERNLLVTSVLGFGFLMLTVFVTSLIADQLIGPKHVNNSIVKEILSNSSVSRAACILVYCAVTPMLEEIIYRGFLLTSLTSEMKWHQAVVVSSAVFSAAHFSGENFIQLFMVGCVLGCSYCWTGNLSSSFVVHSLYNALILLITYLS